MTKSLFMFSTSHPRPVVRLSHLVASFRHLMGGGSGEGLSF